MKITCYIILLLPLIALALPTDVAEAKIDPVDAITVDSDDIKRIKRAGSGGFDILGSLKNHIAQTISKASASLASSSSSSSSGSSDSGHSHGSSPHHVDVSHFDGWKLKKSIMSTLFEAVKAIAGGITAINGQLIKGSGYAISAGGKLVSASGDAVSNAGKKIALSAKLIESGPSKSHFAKFASLSSGSSGSSGHSGHSGHETSAHGESFTSYEGPTAAQQTPYGPPSHSPPPPSGPSSSGHIEVSGPSSYHSSYGTPVQGEQYVPPKVEDDNTVYPPLTGLINVKTQAIHNAADALRQILNKLPIDKPASNEHDTNSHIQVIQQDKHHHDTGPPRQIQQYAIPHDPSPPPFRPLNLTPSYPAAAPPVNSITYTQIITTAYGAPITNYQKPVSLIDVDTSNKWTNIPIGPGVSQLGIDAEPLNMYHVMSLKNSASNNNNHVHVSSVPVDSYLPSNYVSSQEIGGHDNHLQYSAHPSQSQSKFHEQTLPQQYGPPPAASHEFAQNSLGPGYEIHKSVGFELRTSPHLQRGQRRVIKVRRPNH